VLRYLASGWVQSVFTKPWLPMGTLAVNVIGCLGIGFLSGLIEYRQMLEPEARFFLLVGVLGGFTTFSTFGYETFSLARDGETLAVALNVGLSVTLGVCAVWAGHVAARFT
jgi:CrcB protein